MPPDLKTERLLKGSGVTKLNLPRGFIMFNQFHQKRGRYSRRLNRILLLLAILLLWVVPAVAMAKESVPAATEEKGTTPMTSNGAGTAPEAKACACKGLKPFNNLDELLYQFYINLDSDCLFNIPVAELEKVWNIKILSEERVEIGEASYKLRMGPEFRGKIYKSENDTFFMEIKLNKKNGQKNYFELHITEEYYKKYASLFPKGNLPVLLPKPTFESLPPSVHGRFDAELSDAELSRIKNPGGYSALLNQSYIWPNSDSISGQSHEIRFWGGWLGVTFITID